MSEYLWGVDVGFESTTIAAIEGERVHFGRPRPDDGPLPARLESLAFQTECVAAGMAESFPPLCVVVEQPFGSHRAANLFYATGAVLIGLQRALRDRYAHPVSIFQITGPEIKKQVIGRGNALKGDVMAWAAERADGAHGWSEHEADAYVIAKYAERAVS